MFVRVAVVLAVVVLHISPVFAQQPTPGPVDALPLDDLFRWVLGGIAVNGTVLIGWLVAAIKFYLQHKAHGEKIARLEEKSTGTDDRFDDHSGRVEATDRAVILLAKDFSGLAEIVRAEMTSTRDAVDREMSHMRRAIDKLGG